MPTIVPGLTCYWVIPGRLLAGEYPLVKYNEAASRARLRRLLELGIDTFLNLTQPHETIPYQPLLEEEAGWLERTVTCLRHPIRDFGVPTRAEMRAILDAIGTSLQNSNALYLHCYGGIGRTGTVVGCHLARRGTPGAAALAEINHLREAAEIFYPPSPESDEQRALVRSWKKGE